MTILACLAAFPVMVILTCIVSSYVARLVGFLLLAHADALDAYRKTIHTRTVFWFEQHHEIQPALQIERIDAHAVQHS